MSRPPAWVKPVAKRALGAVVALWVAHWVMQTATFRGWLATAAAQQIEAAIGAETKVISARLGLFPPQVRLGGVRIFKDGEIILQADRVRAVGGLDLDLDVLELTAPRVHLRVRDGKLADLPGLEWYATGEPMEALAWRQLVVRNGALRVEVANSDGTRAMVALEGLEILPDMGEAGSNLLLDSLEVRAGEFHQVAEDVRVLSASIGAEGVHLEDIDLAFDVAALGGSFSYAVADSALGGDLQVFVDLGVVSEIAPAVEGVEGSVFLDLSLSGTPEDPVVDGAVLGRPVLVGKEGKRTALGEIIAAFHATSDALVVEGLTGDWPAPGVVVDGVLGWDGTVREASIQAENQQFTEHWERTTGSPNARVEFSCDVEAHLAGTLRPLSLQGDLELAGQDIVVGARPLRLEDPGVLLEVPWASVRGHMSLTSAGLDLEIDRLLARNLGGTAKAHVGWGKGATLDLKLDLDTADLALLRPFANLKPEGRGRVKARVFGPYRSLQARANFDMRNFGLLGIRWADRARAELVATHLRDLEFQRFRASLGETLVQGNIAVHIQEPLTLEMDILVEDARVSDLSGIFLDIPGLEGTVDGTVALEGEPLHLNGEARLEIRDADLFGETFSEGRARAHMVDGIMHIEEFLLQRHGGAESLFARGQIGRGYGLHLEVLGDGFAVERLDHTRRLQGPLTGSLMMNAQVGGTLFAPEPAGRIALQGTRLFGEPAGSSQVRFVSAEGRMDFRGSFLGDSGSFSGNVGLGSRWAYDIQGEMMRVPWHLLYARAADGSPVRGELDGSFVLEGAFGGEEHTAKAQVDRVTASWRTHALENRGPWSLVWRNGQITLEGIRLVGGRTDLTLGGTMSPRQVNLRGGGELDLEWMEALTGHVSRAEGQGRLDFLYQGPRDDAAPLVALRTEEVFLETPWFPHVFESVAGVLEGGPNGYRLEKIRGRLGGGTFKGGGRIEAREWSPTHFDLQATLANGTIRYLEFLPPMHGDAALSFDGPVDSLLLSGDIELEDILFAETIQWEEWVIDLREKRLVDLEDVDEGQGIFSFDMRVHADDTVRVSNNVADGTCDAELRFVGDTSRPGLLGWVRMNPGGRFTLQGQDFEVLRAELHYVEPWTFDPELDFLLQADVRSREETYRIQTQVAGPFSGWTTISSSEPSLAQADINALLVFGMTREELERFGGINTALLVEGADLVLHGVGLEQRVQQGSGGLVDRVQVVTGVTERGTLVSSEPRIVVEKRVGAPYEFDVIGEFNPNRPADTYLGVEKQLTQNFYMTFYRSGLEEDHGMSLGGAYGADFKLRWDYD